MKYVIFPNLSKKAAHDAACTVCAKLSEFRAEIVMPEELKADFASLPGVSFLPEEPLLAGADFAVAIGGDGTILRCAGRVRDYALLHGTQPAKIVGINTGTLGFLAAFELSELDRLGRLQSGDYAISSRMMLEAEMTGSDHICYALNDIYASRLNGKMCDFAVSVDDRQIGIYRADGIVISTPTGSTAYALSAGGPVMEPDLRLIEMNLICPHSLFARPMLFHPQRHIRITYRGAGQGGLNVHADGEETAVLSDQESFTVTGSPLALPFVDCKGYAFYDALNGKLMQPLKAPGIGGGF